MTLRLDFVGRLAKARRTPQGGVRIPAHLTRVGVFDYRQPDGSTRRELRPPEEVFATDSLESLKLAPVTIGHPGVVTPANYKELAVGIVGENVRPSAKFVAADILVQDAATVTEIERSDEDALVELSCGYRCSLDMTPGVWQGQKYDAVQRGIEYNHVGLGRRNWGRAGNEVQLHLDGADAVEATEGVATTHYDFGRMPPEEIAKLEAERDAANAKAKQLEADNAKLRADAAEGKNSSVSGSSKGIDQGSIDEKIGARLDLLDGARVVLGSTYNGRVTVDGKERHATEAELYGAVIAKTDPDFKCDGRSADYLRARFDFAVTEARRTDAAHANVNAATGAPNASAVAGTETAQDLTKARTDFLAESTKACVNAAPAGSLTKPTR